MADPNAAAAAAAAVPKLDNTFGAILIGVLMSAALWGITCMQTFEYYSDTRKDSVGTKLMVTALFCLDTLHQIFLSHTIYTYSITEHFNLAYLNVVCWSLVAQILVAAFVGLIVQSFFAYRIWILSRNSIALVIGVMIFVLGEFALSVTYFVEGLSVKTFDKLPTLAGLSKAVNAAGAGGDVAIAIILVVILLKSKTGFSKSDSIINQLILYSLNTGFLTSICALASLVAITAWPNTFIFITFYACLSRLYTNSLLATLNARKKLRSQVGSHANSMGTSYESRDVSRAGKSDPHLANGSRHLTIRVETETARGYDDTLVNNSSHYELSQLDKKEMV